MVSFSLRKSPHGLHPPPGLGAICSGEEYGLFERRTIPNFSRVSNSSLATPSFSGERRLACEWTGKPVVGIRCKTPCFGDGFEKVGVVKAGRECRRDANESLTDRDAIFGEVRGEAVPVMTL